MFSLILHIAHVLYILFSAVVVHEIHVFIVCVLAICFCSENNLQEDLFDQILLGRLDFPSPFWDNITDSAKVSTEKHIMTIIKEVKTLQGT